MSSPSAFANASTRAPRRLHDWRMQAYGTDRLRLRDDGSAVLSCRVPKPGWSARTTKTMTSAEHPGTAVLWEDGCWEVVDIEVLKQGLRYTLRPWPETAAMRFTDRYDAATEEERGAEYRRRVAREKGRVLANVFALITGHLPAAVQEQLGSEVGIVPVRMTQISTVLPFVVFVGMAVHLAGSIIEQKAPGIPLWLFLFVVYMFVDSLVRFLFTFSVHKPIGSFPGLVAYAIFYALAPQKSHLIRPFAAPKGSSIRMTPLTPQEHLESAVAVWEPAFTLLSRADQQRVAERYGTAYRKHETAVAAIILIFAALGVVSSFGKLSPSHPTAAISLLVAAGLVAEQVWRIATFKGGPAPSVLRFLVRWAVRRYL